MSNTFDFNTTGRLASDPKLEFDKAGQPRTTFRLAVDDRKQMESGDWETRQTVFHDVVAFGKRAEAIAGTFQSGDAVLVMGKLKASINATQEKTYTNWNVHVAHMAPDPARSVVTIDRTSRGQSAAATVDQSVISADPWGTPAATTSPGISS